MLPKWNTNSFAVLFFFWCSSLVKFYCFIDLLCVYSCQIYYISFVFHLRYYTPTFKYITIFQLHFLKFPKMKERNLYGPVIYTIPNSLLYQHKPTIMLNIYHENSFLTCASFCLFQNLDTCVQNKLVLRTPTEFT